MEIKEQNITRGGEFIINETDSNDVFTPEDFSEEQLMMKHQLMVLSNKRYHLKYFPKPHNT